jgi:hypothetical protein
MIKTLRAWLTMLSENFVYYYYWTQLISRDILKSSIYFLYYKLDVLGAIFMID